jgi:hypothetical protein
MVEPDLGRYYTLWGANSVIYKELLMDPIHGDPQPSLKGTSFIKGLGSLMNNIKAQAKSKGR